MVATEREILAILDACCEKFTFPMLDNGYVYLAATRLSAYRSSADWNIVVEVFGFSPRSGIPDTQIYNFGSNIVNRKKADDFVSLVAFENFIKNNSHNDSHFIYPIEEGDWIETEYGEVVSPTATQITVRGTTMNVPLFANYEEAGVELEQAPNVQIFELCRAIASRHRELVLATLEERTSMIPANSKCLLQLDEWHHPDVVLSDDTPSKSETFRQIAKVLVTGEPNHYAPTLQANTHWANWPDGGQL